jgi:ribosomal protein S18 acetylase RimI-like enzyme
LSLRCAWADADPDSLEALGVWMGERIAARADYISHGELQAGLSLDGVSWRPGAVVSFGKEMRALAGPNAVAQAVEAFDEPTGVRVGAAVVRWADAPPAPHGVIEDLVVDSAARRRGVGQGLVAFIEAAARDRGAGRLFLESGLDNDTAHGFFEGQGFRPVSKVFVKAV